MALKTLYATGDFRYGTRMLKAGDPIEMNAPTARLYKALDKVSETKPRIVVREKPVEAKAEEPAKPKRTTRKRAAAKKK